MIIYSLYDGEVTMKNKDKTTLLRIMKYVSSYKKEYAIVTITLMVSVVLGFCQPLLIRSITDKGMIYGNKNILVISVIGLAITTVCTIAIDLLHSHIFASIHNLSYFQIAHEVFSKLLHLKKCYYDDKNNTEILTFLQMDISQVSSITDRYVVMCVGCFFRIVSGLSGLIILNWKLALFVIAMIPIKYAIVHRLSNKREQMMDELIEENRDFSRWFGDSINGVDELKLWNLFKVRDEVFQKKQREILSLEKQGVMIDSWNTAWEALLEWSVTIVLYLLGGIFVCSGVLSIGSVFAFISFSGYVTGPISALLNLRIYLARIMPSARRLFSFLDMETESDLGTERIKKKSAEICFSDVGFSYEENRKILQNVNLSIAPGEKIAIIGHNGSGKSTILNLLLRLYEPDYGVITYGGTNIKDISINDYRENFAVVSQDPYLFLGNIVENIDVVGNGNRSEIERAMKNSGVSDYLNRMPDGERTQIGRNGAKLSGGEKQKLAVARALLKDSPIIILDEATSGFDVESDEYLRGIILKEMKDKTVIMITHHYNQLDGMDRVYQLWDGKLNELKSKDDYVQN